MGKLTTVRVSLPKVDPEATWHKHLKAWHAVDPPKGPTRHSNRKIRSIKRYKTSIGVHTKQLCPKDHMSCSLNSARGGGLYRGL